MTTTHQAFRPPSRESLSVLVVDAYRDAADSLTELLRLHGHGVQTAYHPAAALAADPPDVVILELRLPGTDGWELVRRMRGRPAEKQPPGAPGAGPLLDAGLQRPGPRHLVWGRQPNSIPQPRGGYLHAYPPAPRQTKHHAGRPTPHARTAAIW